MMHHPDDADAAFDVGWAKRRIAVEPLGYAMSGYGVWSHRAYTSRTPLFARAIAFRDHHGDVVLVCCLDMAMVTQAVRRAVVIQLREHLGALFDEERFVLCCTHTHSSPGGCGHEAMYNWVTPGFSSVVADRVAHAAVGASLAAVESAAPSTVCVSSETFPADDDVAWNRAMRAHVCNPEASVREPTDAHLAVDRDMFVLSVHRDGRPRAILSLFGVHATCLGSHLHAFDGDNKGRAARATERLLEAGGAEEPVAIFAQATAGDVSPHYHGPGQSARRREARRRGDVQYAEQNGALQSDCAMRAARSPTAELHGSVDGVLEFQDFRDIAVPPQHAGGVEGARTVDPCHGVAFFLGTPVDGKGMPRVLGGVARALARRTRAARLAGPRSDPSSGYHDTLYRHQGAKDIMLEASRQLVLGSGLGRAVLPSVGDPTIAEMKREARVGAMDGSPLVPTVLPMQIIRIGQLAIVCCPGEFTTVAGGRLRDVARGALGSTDADDVRVLTYANDYMGYVTTPEEYDAQTYEGGHTVFGRWTLGAFLTRASDLATQLALPRPERTHDPHHRPPGVPSEALALRSDLEPPIGKPPYGPRAWRRILRSIDREVVSELSSLCRETNWHRCDGRRVGLSVELDLEVDVHTLYTALTDPSVTAKLSWPTRTTHVRDGEEEQDRFGSGSLRRRSVAPGIGYTERIIEKVPDELLTWTVESGAPISDHLGTMRFVALDDCHSRLTRHVQLTVGHSIAARVVAPIVWRASAKALLRARALLERGFDVSSNVADLLHVAPDDRSQQRGLA